MLHARHHLFCNGINRPKRRKDNDKCATCHRPFFYKMQVLKKDNDKLHTCHFLYNGIDGPKQKKG
jgi:hypothetical protein